MAVSPDDDRSVALLVGANRLSDGRSQSFVDLTAVREDPTYSGSLTSLHALPPPGYAAREQRHSRSASPLRHPKRSAAARVSNCRTSAMSSSKADRGRRNCAGPNDSGDERPPRVRRGRPDARDRPPWPLQSRRSATRGIPGDTRIRPDQPANSRCERPARQSRFEPESLPSRCQFIEPLQHGAAGGDGSGIRTWQSASQHIGIHELGDSQDIDEQLTCHR